MFIHSFNLKPDQNVISSRIGYVVYMYVDVNETILRRKYTHKLGITAVFDSGKL